MASEAITAVYGLFYCLCSVEDAAAITGVTMVADVAAATAVSGLFFFLSSAAVDVAVTTLTTTVVDAVADATIVDANTNRETLRTVQAVLFVCHQYIYCHKLNYQLI